MTDRENVIKGLNDIGVFIAGRIGIKLAWNFLRTIDDAVAMLKEKEAVKPYVTGRGESFETAETWWYACGNCHEALDPDDKYCRHCGQAVKWE